MDTYKVIPIIDVFHKKNKNDHLIVSFELKYVPVEELREIFGDGLLIHGSLIEKDHEEPLEKLCGVRINTQECTAYIDICRDNTPSKY